MPCWHFYSLQRIKKRLYFAYSSTSSKSYYANKNSIFKLTQCLYLFSYRNKSTAKGKGDRVIFCFEYIIRFVQYFQTLNRHTSSKVGYK